LATTLIDQQVQQVRQSLHSSVSDVESLGRLVAELEVLLAQMDSTEHEFTTACREHWTVLEEVYAVALDRNIPVIDEASKKLVQESISGLCGLLERYDRTSA
jgi:hypothetical protein